MFLVDLVHLVLGPAALGLLCNQLETSCVSRNYFINYHPRATEYIANKISVFS